jgi:hypothetical protein
MMRAILISAAVAVLIGLPALAEANKVKVTGKVVDGTGKPVAHALVIMRDRESNTEVHASTDIRGHYEAMHPPERHCSIQVIPRANSGMAQAILKDVPAEEGRHMVISVHPGFLIHGRVMSGDKPLRNVRVRAVAQEGDALHDGGEATTDGHGRYEMVLTAGNKVLEVTRGHDRAGSALVQHECNVTADGALADITVPAHLLSGLSK